MDAGLAAAVLGRFPVGLGWDLLRCGFCRDASSMDGCLRKKKKSRPRFNASQAEASSDTAETKSRTRDTPETPSKMTRCVVRTITLQQLPAMQNEGRNAFFIW